MTKEEVIHIKAANYANDLKKQFLQKVKEGAIEPRTKEMEGWIWMAQYEGYRDALQDQLKEFKQEPVAWMDKQVTPEDQSVRLTAFKEVAEAWGFSVPLYTHPVDDTTLLRQCFEAMQDIERTGDVQAFCMCDVPKLFPALRERLGEKT